MAEVMDTMAILVATTMETGIVIILVQGVALAIDDEIKEQRGKQSQYVALPPKPKAVYYPPNGNASQLLSLLSPIRMMRITMRIMARVVIMAAVTIITTIVVWKGAVIGVGVWIEI